MQKSILTQDIRIDKVLKLFFDRFSANSTSRRWQKTMSSEYPAQVLQIVDDPTPIKL
jgi:hypothetical protein